jgi:hypothetical protein
MNMEHWRNNNSQGKSHVLGEKPTRIPHCPPQTLHNKTLELNPIFHAEMQDVAMHVRAWVLLRPCGMHHNEQDVLRINGNHACNIPDAILTRCLQTPRYVG